MTIALGCRDRNVHELVCHETALRLGEYERRGIEVEIIDETRERQTAVTVALGGSSVERLQGQRTWTIRLAHTVRPLFWLRAGRPLEAAALRGHRIATHPVGSLPWRLTTRVLTLLGAAIDDVEPVPFPSGAEGDLARLEAILSGAVAAGVVGSAVAPAAAERLGACEVASFGDVLRLPTVGIAADADRTTPDDPSLAALIDAHRAGASALRGRQPGTVEAVHALLREGDRTDAADFRDRYLAPHYGVSTDEARRAGADYVAWMATELGVIPIPEDLYHL